MTAGLNFAAAAFSGDRFSSQDQRPGVALRDDDGPAGILPGRAVPGVTAVAPPTAFFLVFWCLADRHRLHAGQILALDPDHQHRDEQSEQ